MHRSLKSALAAGTLFSTVLATTGTAAAQTNDGLCNGLEPTIVGTEGADVIQGTWDVDVIVGLGGDDVIRGMSGADVICGGNGNDVIYGDSQDDIIFGENGDDELYGGSDKDTIYGGNGDDLIYGDSQDDTLFGENGNDMINGGPDSDALDGGKGYDILDGSWQTDSCANGEATDSCESETQSDHVDKPVLLSSPDVAWVEGSSEWLNLMWTGDVEFSNLQVTVSSTSNGVEVEYPGGATNTMLNTDADLSTAEIDFTALKFTTSKPGAKKVSLDVSWTDGSGDEYVEVYDITLSNVAYEGDDFAILTTVADSGTDPEDAADNWIDLEYKGLSPTNRDMAMSISSDVPVYYPQDTFTSLHHDEVLHAGETDVARVWFDPEQIEAGEFVLEVTVDYVDFTGKKKSVTHEVTLTIVE